MNGSHDPEIASLPQHLQDLIRLTQHEGAGGEDRSLAIIQVSYVERYLGEALKVYLPGLTGDMKKSMFRPDGLLGSLGRMNDMSKALGITDGVDHNQITVLGSIRNKFAHNLEIDSFNHPVILERVTKLVPREKWCHGGKSAMDEHFKAMKSSPRAIFFGISQQYCISLSNFFALLNSQIQKQYE